MKTNSTWSFFTNTFVRILILLIVIFFLYNIVKSILKNHEITKEINDFANSITILENDRLNLKNRIIFYNTDIYKEIEARKHLNYQKKDERVVVLIKKTPDNIDLNNATQDINSSQNETETMPNWQKWLQFIFG